MQFMLPGENFYGICTDVVYTCALQGSCMGTPGSRRVCSDGIDLDWGWTEAFPKGS